MFCPGCGLEELQSANQFCRACGTDLRSVRFAMEKPADNITASAMSARDEIGRAIAAKIRQMQDAEELSIVVEDVLPEIEKFLESPEEKRLRGIRRGATVMSIGIGSMVAFFMAAVLVGDKGIFMVAGAGLATVFVGLSLILNAIFFSTPRKSLPADKSDKAQSQRELDYQGASASGSGGGRLDSPTTNDLVLPSPPAIVEDVFSSVTEHTTHQLAGKKRAKN